MAYPTHGPEYHERDSWKQPCRAATTANITISTALNNGDTLDGVTLATGDRVLVKDQSTGSQNGIYVVGASPARSVDYGSQAEVLGSVVLVTNGTANADTIWMCTTNAAITVGSTALVFAQVGAGGGGAAQFTDDSPLYRFPNPFTGIAQEAPSGGEDSRATFTTGNIEFTATIATADNADNVGTTVDINGSGDALFYAHLFSDTGAYATLQMVLNHVTLDANTGPVDLRGRSIMFPHAASAPSSPVENETYYDDTLHKLRTYDGTSWQNHW